MASVSYYIIISSLLLLQLHNTEGLLQLSFNPRDITVGLSETLTVNCSFTYAGVSNITSIISMIVSKADLGNNQGQFTELESLNVFKPHQFTGLSQLDASVTGQIDAAGESYLSIEWKRPTANNSGVYRCEAHGVDDAGHPTEITQTIQVTWRHPDLDKIIDKVGQLQNTVERQENISQNLLDTLNDVLAVSKNQSDLINSLQTQLNRYGVMFHILEKKFDVSSEYKGHYYLISKQNWENAEDARMICEEYAGYLVEINDKEEHEFIQSFLNKLGNVFFVLLGITDEGHDGNWVYMNSGDPVTYFDWHGSEPDDPDYNCTDMAKGYDWKMYDHPCSMDWKDEKFLCEVDVF